MTPTLSGAIDHVHVYVKSRRAAADWYRKILGFSTVEKYAFWANDKTGPLVIADENDKIHFALFHSAKPKPVSVAFGTDADEYKAWKSHLQSAGVSFEERDHTLCHSIYFSDPFDNALEVTSYDVGQLRS